MSGRSDFRLLAHHPLPVRFAALITGLFLFGTSCGLIIASGLGNAPWDVLHEGVSKHIPLQIGTIAIIVSVLLLLLWIPLKQKPGVGTILNALMVGLFIDLTLHIVHTPDALWAQIGLLVGGVLLNGVATVLYIIPNFGPGPRDGLMTGLVAVTGKPVFVIRSLIEIVVMGTGWLLGGTLFIGTFLYAFGIGPVTQVCLAIATRLIGPPDPFSSDDT